MIPSYTLVCAVDRKHLEQLKLVWPTWKRHKSTLLKHPMLIFFDRFSLHSYEIFEAIDHPNLTCIPWPPGDKPYPRLTEEKFGNPQRYKMLAGFVHVPAMHVKTDYWLKLDVDTVANGQDDWISEDWFNGTPAIIAQPWGFTRPKNQMQLLDRWAEGCAHLKFNSEPLRLPIDPDADKLSHKRIISWCGLFNTNFTKDCSRFAEESCGEGFLPVPSQDGYMWYIATRLGMEIKRPQMKTRGWEHWTTMENIRKAVAKALV